MTVEVELQKCTPQTLLIIDFNNHIFKKEDGYDLDDNMRRYERDIFELQQIF